VVTALKRKWDEDDARSSVFEEWEDGEDDAVVTTGNSSTSSGQQRSSVNNHPGAASVSTSGVAGLTTQIADIIRLGGGMAGRTVRLCTPSLVYFAQRDSYTCGYRNLQMLLSSLPQGDPKWTCALQKFSNGRFSVLFVTTQIFNTRARRHCAFGVRAAAGPRAGMEGWIR